MSSSLLPASVQEAARAEPAWLQAARADAFGSFRTLEPPQGRRTDLARLDVESLALRAAGRPPRRALAKLPGVLHLPLGEAAREHEDLVRPLLGGPIEGDDKWARLHAAAWSAGSLLYVEKGVEVGEPIRLDTPHGPEGAVVRDLVALGRQAKASLVARSTGGGADAFSIEGVDVHLGEGASLSLATLQDLRHEGTLLSYRRVRLQRDSRLAWVDGQFGARTLVAQNEVRLAGQGSGLRFIGAFFGSKDQHMDMTTSALHAGPHTESRLDMKGALNEDGYSVNSSVVNIGPGAPNSSGHQHQETLLLSDKARADAIPKLDVENNDVSASHGATVGQVDPEQLFYL
ncbi:MAG TPA: SufD family Fe-S cluster assembly protein, partial [Candidatus Thermoplasmatota archaeon]|nr:SufD family Fe-S cluster assembly protein [Candidatus Thermoplasmatota archaeon]